MTYEQGNALRCWAKNDLGADTIAVAGKTYFGATTGDCQFDAKANFFNQPRYCKIEAAGIYVVPLTNAATLTVGIDIVQGGVPQPVTSIALGAPVISATGGKGWMMSEFVSLLSGSKKDTPGVAQPTGFVGLATSGALGAASFGTLVNLTAMNVDTTQPLSIKLWAQWSAIGGGQSITLQTCSFVFSD